MKKIELGQALAILANAGVIAGIAFLALELQQTQNALTAQAYQARAFDSRSTAWQEISLSDEVLNLISGVQYGQVEYPSLPPAQRRRLFMFWLTMSIDLDNEHYQYERGLLEPEFYFTSTVPTIREHAPIWRSIGVGEARPAFSEAVDDILADL